MRTSPASDWLVLVPTELERNALDLGDHDPHLIGFGPMAAAAMTAATIAAQRPRRVLLAGIAGSFDGQAFPIGSAQAFGEVRIDQLGVGQGEEHISAQQLGFPQLDMEPPLFDRVQLQQGTGLLVTTPLASATPEEAAARQQRHPEALAEDMEGFGVALACHLFSLPLWIVRGASNQVGERDKAQWQIEAALQSVRQATLALLEQPFEG